MSWRSVGAVVALIRAGMEFGTLRAKSTQSRLEEQLGLTIAPSSILNPSNALQLKNHVNAGRIVDGKTAIAQLQQKNRDRLTELCSTQA
ncbi:MAG: hypothetical protein VKJ24_19215 [Synechococcales bacterium]|nr:hypothetical protein [Synechococcales bacterium]